jgi:division protein CdvB (Snf7/Vps24/ESCRT-III family)
MYHYLAAKYVKVKAELDILVQKVTEQLSVTQTVKIAQAQQITVQTQQSEATYAQRQQTEAAKGAAYRAMNERMAALFPTPRQGVSNDL